MRRDEVRSGEKIPIRDQGVPLHPEENALLIDREPKSMPD
jgi:hypothetical protein